jgi:hypothetical protein
MNKKRVMSGVLLGAILGIVCIVGATVRTSVELSNAYLLAFWYNRLLMGLVIGLFPSIPLKKALIRGAVIGLLVSFAFYSATTYQDLMGFLVGALYGVVIEYSLFKVKESK